jgi:putative hydrolase of HD superfamily
MPGMSPPSSAPPSPPSSRLGQQVAFVLEIDRLKQIARQTLIADGSRRENDAEHSWHLAVMAMLLGEYAPTGADLARVTRMLLVHDLVEIDAGDTYCYDPAACGTQAERERAAADRIFALLPADQGGELRGLWEEFEARQTPEARFAAALDRVQPVLLNYHTQGRAWQEHAVTRAQVIERNCHIEAGAPRLWAYVLEIIEDSVARGYLKP